MFGVKQHLRSLLRAVSLTFLRQPCESSRLLAVHVGIFEVFGLGGAVARGRFRGRCARAFAGTRAILGGGCLLQATEIARGHRV